MPQQNHSDASPFERSGSGAQPSQDVKMAEAVMGSESIVQSREFVLMMATVSGGVAERNVFIPALAEQLRKASKSDTTDEIFQRVNAHMLKTIPTQLPIFHSTLTRSLCLKNFYRYQRNDTKLFGCNIM